MSGISSSVGLNSGLDIQALVDSLIAIESRPRDLLQVRIQNLQAQKSAYSDISSRIAGMLSRLTSLKLPGTFRAATATSSDTSILSVTASSSTALGSYSFVAKSLASTQQVISRGFQKPESTIGSGTLTLESAKARVDHATRLDTLNGYRGVQRGSFTIEDAAGNIATIRTTDALTLNEVIQQINDADLDVTAAINGDHIELSETTGGALRVREVGAGRVASDLGFAPGYTLAADGALSGASLVVLSDQTPLRALNDGIGLRAARAGGDFRVLRSNGPDLNIDLSGLLQTTTRLSQLNDGDGVDLGVIKLTTTEEVEDEDRTRTREFEIDLTGLTTIGEVKTAIEDAVESVTVSLSDNRLTIGYTDTEITQPIKVEDVSGSAAADLGIDGESDIGKLKGRGLLAMESLADVVAAINNSVNNDGTFVASLSGAGIVLTDTTGGAFSLETVTNADGEPVSSALSDLGIAEGAYSGAVSGQRVLAGLNTVLLQSLNGGRGYDLGTLEIDAGGLQFSVDISEARTLQDVIDTINVGAETNGVALEAQTDGTGTRLLVQSLDGVSAIQINDGGGGNFAETLGLTEPATTLRSENLQRQYVSANSLLTDMRNGRGIGSGTFQIQNANGAFAEINFANGEADTLDDIIRAINTATIKGAGESLGVHARVNDTGDGLLIEDQTGGGGALIVTDLTGNMARDLNIAGESDEGAIDGSYEVHLDISGSESLDDIIERINDAGDLAKATLLNDGTGITPYRLQISSAVTGTAGALVIDGSDLGLDFTTLTRAQDATLLLGDGASSGVLLTSSSNTFADALPGMSITLNGASADPVSVTVGQDTEKLYGTLEGFVNAYNDAIDRIAELSDYDTETEQRGILLGDGTVQVAERRIQRLINGRVPGATGTIDRLSDLGVNIRDGKLVLNRERFEEAFSQDPDAVIEFFTDEDDGFAVYAEEQIEALTDVDGLLDRREQSLERQVDQFDKRIESMNDLLNLKRDRLLRQFYQMETALGELNAQQSALSSLAALVPTASA